MKSAPGSYSQLPVLRFDHGTYGQLFGRAEGFHSGVAGEEQIAQGIAQNGQPHRIAFCQLEDSGLEEGRNSILAMCQDAIERVEQRVNAESRIIELGIDLPEPAVPVGSYVTSVQCGNLLYLAGHLPAASEGSWAGKVGSDYTAAEGASAARAVAINCLATIRTELGSLDRVRRVVKVLGFVNSAPGFSAQPTVINGFSDLMAEVFGDVGRHARSAVGANELPLDTPVEVEMIVAFE